MKRILAVAAMMISAWTTHGHGAETQLWISDSPDDYARAESRGVVVQPDGVLALGPRAVSSPADSTVVIWAIAVLADGSVALAGDGGRVDRWTEAGGVKPWVKLPVGQVLSLAADGDQLVAGTGPDGLIFRIGARGDTSLLVRTGERYVWGLAPASRGSWWAATGTRGRLLKVERGKSQVALDSDESNLVSLISDGRGGCYAGGDSKGRVLHVTAAGVASTVYDAAEDEVRALAVGPQGALYAAALTASARTAVPAGGGSGSAADDDGGEDRGSQPQPARSAVSGGRATLYRIVPDSSVAAVWTSPHPFVFALASVREGVVAATGNRAALYLVGRTLATQWLAAPQGQITALATDRGGRLFAATSNPGMLWRIGPERAERGELLSALQDARRHARFGSVVWRGTAGGGRVELQTRSGNTDPPDTTWTAWRPLQAGRSTSPPARYLQWKVALASGNPRVDAVEVAWREQNLAPRVEELVVAPQGTGFREGELQPRTQPVTQTLPGGQRVEYSVSTTDARALKELPEWARGLRTLQWRGNDPNGDPLKYRVDVRPEGGEAWTRIAEDLDVGALTWDTRAMPDGRYRVRVRASDAPGNAVGEELTTETTSEPFQVDNTAPQILEFEVCAEGPGTVVATGRAEDDQSILSRLEIRVDGEEWRAVSPEGGLADDRALTFRVRLSDLDPGEHSVAVRAVDRAGNGVSRAATVTVQRGR